MRTKSTSRTSFVIVQALLGSVLYSVGLLSASTGLSQTVTGIIATKAVAETPGDWTVTGSMTSRRADHTATLLANRHVLVAGGNSNNTSLTSAELYDPATGQWTTTGSMVTGRDSYTATLLANGQVLVAGGFNQQDNVITASAELYDPVSSALELSSAAFRGDSL